MRRKVEFTTVGEFIVPPAVRRVMIHRHDDDPAAVPQVTANGIRYTAAVFENGQGDRIFKVHREGATAFTYRPGSARQYDRGSSEPKSR